MAEVRHGFGDPDEETQEGLLPADASSSTGPPTADAIWPVYDGRPGEVSDGTAPVPATAPQQPPSWWWAVVGFVGVTVIMVGFGGVLRSTRTVPQPPPPDAVAPGWWSPVSPALTAGAALVSGAAEADGIVLSSSGVVATSYSRIKGERRPRDFQLDVVADGEGWDATLLVADEDTDIALIRVSGSAPSGVANPGTPAQVGDTLTLLDVQGRRQPVLGIGVTVTATDQVCSRAGSEARPVGFQFSLDVATAEPGAALVRADGTVVGMYYGGDDATHHCAIPIADVVEVMQAHHLED